MTSAYIADSVKEIVIGFVSMTRLYKNRNIEMKPTTVICKGVLVRFLSLCIKRYA
jgi:hypothetical protein